MLPWLLLLFLGGVSLVGFYLLYQHTRALREQILYAESAQRQATSQYRQALQLRDSLFNAITDGVLLLDENQRIVLMNQAAETLLDGNLTGETLIVATRHYELDTLVQNARLDDQDTNEKQIELNEYMIRARVFPIQTMDGRLSILILRDETMLRRLSRARRDMVANISHELRTPITTISLLVDTLLGGAMDKKKNMRKMLKDIQRETATLTQLVQEMRDLSLIESGQMPVKLTASSLSSIVYDGIDSLASLAENKEQTLQIDIPEALVVLADANQLQRVLKNIVHNAIKFTPIGGTIRVWAEIGTADDEVQLGIQDTGPGIAKENLDRIFERFFQENRARSDGTGLGLAIARHIILAHGGRIWAISAPNAGTCFYFTVPLEVNQTKTLQETV
ncbi:MAG: sensor histidine kinase [Anaerolineales bacterium]